MKKCISGLFLLVALGFTMFTSCKNLFSDSQSLEQEEPPRVTIKYGSVRGKIDLDEDIIPESIIDEIKNAPVIESTPYIEESPSRTAFSHIPYEDEENVHYKIFAVLQEDIETLPSEYLSIINDIKEIEGKTFGTNLSKTYHIDEQIPMNLRYTLVVKVYYYEDLIMGGESEEFTVTDENPEIENFSIDIYPLKEGKGTVDLSFLTQEQIDKGFKLYYKFDTFGVPEKNTSLKDTYNTSENGKIEEEIVSGVYTLRIKIFDQANNLKYACSEVINVFDNLVTNTWINNSDDDQGYLQESDNGVIFEITDNLIEKFEKHTFYVDPLQKNSSEPDPNSNPESDSEANSETNQITGSFYHPFKTLQEAIDYIYADKNNLGYYEIKLINSITDESPYKDSYVGKFENNKEIQIIISSHISSYNENSKKRKSISFDNEKTHKNNGNSSNAGIFYFNAPNSTITFENIDISGSNSKTAIYNKNAAVVFTNVNITDCYDTKNGNESDVNKSGTIYNEENGTITLNNVTINNQCVMASDSLPDNIYARGIYNVGDCTLNGTTIENCRIKDKNNTPLYGADIYNDGTLSIEGKIIASDVYLTKDKVLDINGSLEGSKIGVTTEIKPELTEQDDIKVAITQGFNNSSNSTLLSNILNIFTSNDNFQMHLNENGEVEFIVISGTINCPETVYNKNIAFTITNSDGTTIESLNQYSELLVRITIDGEEIDLSNEEIRNKYGYKTTLRWLDEFIYDYNTPELDLSVKELPADTNYSLTVYITEPDGAKCTYNAPFKITIE